MYYAQFWQKSAISEKLVEACGDRAVIILDGRQCMGVMKDLSLYWGRKRGYLAYQIHRGESFTRSQPITDVIPI